MKYRAEIDGMRALAVIPVVLFHAGFELFAGGFVGVDVFFVISGYLITTILINEIEDNRFSIITFYERRARRILPALFFIILCCMPFAWKWMMPAELKDFSQSLIAVGLFVSNFLFWQESGYFDLSAEEKPLLHTWSLAVEEQYYLLFPLFLMMLWRLGKRPVIFSLVALFFVSLALSEIGWRKSPDANFYLAHSRAWELFAGSIAAFIVQRYGVMKNDFISLVGLIAILFAIFYFNTQTPFPSVYALLPVLGVVAIIIFGGKQTLVAKILGSKYLVGIGMISYSAYLWHQPLLAFARIRVLTEPSVALLSSLCLLAFVLAYFSWRFVEQPFRNKQQYSSRFIAYASFSGLLFIIGVGVLGHTQNGFANRLAGDQTYDKLGQRISANYGLSIDCEGAFNNSINCKTSAKPDVLLWGDSLAMHISQGLISSLPNIALQQQTLSACSPILGVAQYSLKRNREWGERCIGFNNDVYKWLENTPSIKLVILSSPFKDIVNKDLFFANGTVADKNTFNIAKQYLIDTATKIRATGAKVMIVSPTPTPIDNWHVGNCLVKSRLYNYSDDACDFELNTKTRSLDLLRAVEQDISIYWLYNDICRDNNVCDTMQEDVFIFRDSIHLSREGSAYLGKKYSWFDAFNRIAN